MVEAGFRYIEGSEDSTMCVVCQKELEGWEEGDSPRSVFSFSVFMQQCYREEHQRHSPQCPFLLIADPYKLTVRQVLQLESQAMEYIKVGITSTVIKHFMNYLVRKRKCCHCVIDLRRMLIIFWKLLIMRANQKTNYLLLTLYKFCLFNFFPQSITCQYQ